MGGAAHGRNGMKPTRYTAACGCILAAAFALATSGCGVPVGAHLTSGASDTVTAGFTTVGRDTASRFFHRASRLNDGRVMVCGGLSLAILPPSLVTLRVISFFDPDTRSFTTSDAPGSPVMQLSTPRSSHTQTTLPDGRVLIAGGNTGASGTSVGPALDSTELFDPTELRTAPGPPMSEARAAHTATRLADGRVVVAGGSGWQVFTPGTDAWSAPASMQRRRAGHAAVLIADHLGQSGDGRVLLVGGTGNGGDTLELLDPATMTSVLLTSRLAVGVDDLTAARLPDGRVLIVGGQMSNGDTTDRTYLCDVAADRLTDAPPPPDRPDGISDHQMVVLDTHACIFGGEQEVAGQDTELDYFAVFDPTRDEWTLHGTMQFIHDDFAAVPLSDRSILLVGGGAPLFGHEAPTANAEIFELTTRP